MTAKKNRIIKSAFAGLFLLAALCGCKSDEKIFPEVGIKISMPKKYEDMGLVLDTYQDPISSLVIFAAAYENPEEVQKLRDEYEKISVTDEQAINAIDLRYTEISRNIALTFILPDEYFSMLQEENNLPENGTIIGKGNGLTYFCLFEDENSAEGMSEADKAAYKTCYDYMKKAVKTIKIIPIQAEDAAPEQSVSKNLEDSMPKTWTSFTLDGKDVDQSLFEAKDITVLNVWGTFCEPCISEMPDLGKWADELPENVQIVGLVDDLYDTTDEITADTARSIMSGAGADFVNIAASLDWEVFLAGVSAVPTTFFIGSDGKFLHDPVVGANINAYREIVQGLLNER